MPSPSTILVTGGAGFIGSALVRRLVATTPATVVTVDALTYAGNLDSLAPVLEHPRHQFERADVSDAPAMRALLDRYRPDAIAHLAAESHVDRSLDGPAEFVRTNVVGTFTLLEAAREYLQRLDEPARDAFRFLHVSTDEVFGSAAPAERFDETTGYRPNSPYSATKAAGDHLARAWHRSYGLPVLTTNCGNNYGPYQFPEKLIPLVILAALEGRELPLYGDGAQERDWLHVDDHVDALLAVLQRGAPGETYCVGGGANRRNIEVVRAVCDILDELAPDAAGPHARRIAHVPDRPGHDRRYAIDGAKLERDLGWRPSRDFAHGLRDTVRWYLDNRWWWERVRSGAYRMGADERGDGRARAYDGERLGLGTAR